MVNFIAYHGKTGNEHQQQFNLLADKGYRITSLSIYGNSSDPRYAAVWIKRKGPEWIAFHGKKTNEYQQIFDDNTKNGFRPIIISATGLKSKAVFAGVFEKDGTPFVTKHHLVNGNIDDENTLEYWLNWARENRFFFRWASVYGGSKLSPVFVIILEKNIHNLAWGIGYGEDHTSYQHRFEAQNLQWARPYFVTSISNSPMSSGDYFLSLFRDDQLGLWDTKHGMTESQYQNYFNDLDEKGYYPLMVQGGAESFKPRYSAIFVKTEKIAPRKWTVTGQPIPQLSKFDDYMKKLMQENNVRAGSLAIVKDGKLIFAHAYTWAESGYPIAQPTSSFRILSMSKTLTSIAIHQFIGDNKITLDSFIQSPSLLNIKKFDGGNPVDPRWQDVRVWHLLSHMGGWKEGTDWTAYDFDIVNTAGKDLPANKNQVASYVAGRQDAMSFNPGTLKNTYSNFGYTLLGLLVEKISGKKYSESVIQTIFKPLGVNRAKIGRSLKSLQDVNQVRQHMLYPDVSKNVINNNPPIVPFEYGGWNVEKGDSGGGWIMAPCDYAKVLASFDMDDSNPIFKDDTIVTTMWTNPFPSNKELLRGWFRTSDKNGNDYLKNTNGNAIKGVQHNGGMPGGATLGLRRSDKLSFILFLNLGIKGGLHAAIHGVALNNIGNKITKWPSSDLFPIVGLPSFN